MGRRHPALAPICFLALLHGGREIVGCELNETGNSQVAAEQQPADPAHAQNVQADAKAKRKDERELVQPTESSPNNLAATVEVVARAEDASVAVLDEHELAATAAPRLDDALRQVAGFSLFRRTSSRVANPTTQGASLRAVGGSGAGRALVLDDGIPLSDPFGGWIAWGRVPRLALERLEVLRGGSSLYGTSALAGVVQAVRRSDEDTLVAAEGSLGSEGTSNASLYAGGKAGPWSGSISGESFATDGYVLVAPEDRGPIDVAATSRQRVLEGSGGRRLGEGRLFLRASAFDEERGNGTPAQTNETHLDQAAVGWDGPVGGGETRARIYGVQEDYDQTFSSIGPGRASETLTRWQHVPSSALGTTAQWSRPLSTRFDVLAGVEGSRVRGESQETLIVGTGGTSVSGGTQVSLAAFADGHARVGTRNVLGAGVRFDRWDNQSRDGKGRTASFLGPRVSWRYETGRSSAVTASAWSSFRAPTLNELYRSFQTGGVLTQANPDLGPEKLRGVELGGGVGRRVRGGARVFWMGVDDAILNVTLASDPTGDTRRRENVGRTETTGVELDLDARPSQHWLVGSSVLLADARVVDGGRVPQVPRAQGTLQVRYDATRGTRIGLQARFSGPAYEDDLNALELSGLHVVDVFASIPIVRGLEAFAAAENVFDDRYDAGKTPVTTLGAPRTFRGGVRVSWSPTP